MKQTSFFRLTFLCLVVILGLASGNGCRKPTEQPCPLPPSPPTPCDLSKPSVKQWDKVFGGTSDDVLNISSLHRTNDGGYILGGFSNSGIGGDKSQTGQGGQDYWVVKTNASGVKQWDKTYGGSGDDLLYAVKSTADGGYILGGNSKSAISGDKTVPNEGQNDYWIIKTDANGNKQWDKKFGGSGDDQLRAVQQTTDGGYILGGVSNSGKNGDKSQASQGIDDFWIIKVNANGVKQWDKTFGGNGYDYLSSLQQTVDGGYILGGLSFSGISGDKTQPNHGTEDFWILKINSAGIKQWDATFGGIANDRINSLQQISDGGYILGGYSNSGISGDKTENCLGENDYWIVKTNANGIKQWDRTFGGAGDDLLWSLQLTCDGGYILGGQSNSDLSGNKTGPCKGLSDYWVVKTDASGVKQWDKTFGGSAIDAAFALIQASDGGFILGGVSRTEIDGDKSQPNRGGNDFWIVKLGSQ